MMASPRDISEELELREAFAEGKQLGNEAIHLPRIDFSQKTRPGLDAFLSFSFARTIYLPTTRIMQNTNCPHPERKHYAKNMCSACYHKTARPSRAWKCAHRSLPLYAKGRCHDCYVTHYYGRKPHASDSS